MKWMMMIRNLGYGGYKNLRMRIIKCSLHLNSHLTFRFHIVVS